jgi:hypothetical protein
MLVRREGGKGGLRWARLLAMDATMPMWMVDIPSEALGSDREDDNAMRSR